MGIPQITDRMRSAPVQALRTVFAGIGRILLAADRPPAPAASPVRQAGADSQDRQRESSGPRTPDPVGPAESRWRSLDKTGNVRLLSADDQDDDDRARPVAAAAEPAYARPAQASSAEADASLAEPEPEPELELELELEPELDAGPAALPLASYDTLSLPSIRARLRGLDADQLRVLVGYEQLHAERPEVLGMLERRIEKLETGG